MTSGNAHDLNSPLFSAVLRPNPPLGRNAFLVLMLVFGSVSAALGVLFLVLNAWPVSGFFGVDALLLYWAFRINSRDSRAYELVTVTRSALTVRKVNPRGGVQEWTLNPLWVRLDRETIEDFGVHRLFLVSRGQRLPVANVLGPQEKEGFAAALAAALAHARRGAPCAGT